MYDPVVVRSTRMAPNSRLIMKEVAPFLSPPFLCLRCLMMPDTERQCGSRR